MNVRYEKFDVGLYVNLITKKYDFDRVVLFVNFVLCESIDFSTPEIKVKVTDDCKFEIVKDVLEYVKSKNYKFIDIDGVRVQFEDGWALVRASNTGPNLTIRFEAKDENRLKEIQEEFENVINEEKKKFNL